MDIKEVELLGFNVHCSIKKTLTVNQLTGGQIYGSDNPVSLQKNPDLHGTQLSDCIAAPEFKYVPIPHGKLYRSAVPGGQ